jgi:hypothetical protein
MRTVITEDVILSYNDVFTNWVLHLLYHDRTFDSALSIIFDMKYCAISQGAREHHDF